ncbi:DUF1990 family protein [Streptomyces jumonjinensis]|uniref:DUF1990 domain-containing protein n=1 Tax=Streptomyces jumonjinensis TaxID=1945 RepID=A0A646KEV7_STRJU|nr:DUF1990 domain-containing protein [Streptomyces jumonjinensis]MQT00734.1 DUF1990 domain-containing protein [Streptomyces jumonjinensis]
MARAGLPTGARGRPGRAAAVRPAPVRHTLTYPEVGATRLGPMPDGYRHLHHTTRVGRGRAAFTTAGAAVLSWRMHRESGVRVRATAARAEPGVRVELSAGAGPLRIGAARCEVIWSADERHRAGFAYGTLSGHPECGEESFVVDFRDDGSVWFTVMAFSRPGRWYTRAAGPLVPVLQLWYARRLGRTVRRLAADGDTGSDGVVRRR